MTESKKTLSFEQPGLVPSLCFGTFFNLLCQSRNNLGTGKKSKNAPAQREVAEHEVFSALMHIGFGNDNYSIKSNELGYYKSCKRNKDVPCQKEPTLSDFNNHYADEEGYGKIFSRATEELISLLDPSKDEALVNSIIALLSTAKDINGCHMQVSPDEQFRISTSKYVTKKELCDKDLVISFSHFLLDVYHFVLNNCPDNRIGEATYNEWCPKESQPKDGNPRILTSGPDISVVKASHKVIRLLENDSLNAHIDDYTNTDSSSGTAATANDDDTMLEISQDLKRDTNSGMCQVTMVQHGSNSIQIGSAENFTINII